MVRGAADGDDHKRSEFAAKYESAARAYLAARWRRSPRLSDLDDAVQEVFVECFRAGGALDRIEVDRAGGFRAFFYGIVRNVALRAEVKSARLAARELAADTAVKGVEADDTQLSQVFDRAWAQSIMREAAVRQAENARAAGPEAERRVEMLRLRFQEDMPIREIAAQWSADPVQVHREYAKARREFRTALEEVMRFYFPGNPKAADAECENLLALLSD